MRCDRLKQIRHTEHAPLCGVTNKRTRLLTDEVGVDVRFAHSCPSGTRLGNSAVGFAAAGRVRLPPEGLPEAEA